jgi:hypothetical protein
MSAARQPPPCPLCGHPAESHWLVAPDGGVRTAERILCGTCGSYDITQMLIATLKRFPNNTATQNRYRLSAITRAAAEEGTVLELSANSASAFLERTPQPGALEQMDRVLKHLAARAPRAGEPVVLDLDTDYPIASTDGRDGLQFIVAEMVKEGLIAHVGPAHVSEYRITMAGHRRIGEFSKAAYTPTVTKRSDHSDVFICHASEDKEEVARPLYTELTKRGFKVWFDEATLTLGDSLPAKIDVGLASCRFGVVILSPSFFAKNWTRKELDGLAEREAGTGQKVILPVWHKVSIAEVRKYSPTLASKVGIETSKDLDAIVQEIVRVLEMPSGAQAS